jgi:hypothetical protein
MRLASTGALALAGACGGGSSITDTGSTNGSFTLTLTGGSAGTYSGNASIAVNSSGLTTIELGTPDGKFGLIITSRSGLRPAVGSYPIVAPSTSGSAWFLNATTNFAQFAYASTSGTLTITASSSVDVRGNFTFNGTPIIGGGAATSGSASFVAVCRLSC